MGEISIERFGWRKWPEFGSEWDRIHKNCPTASFFNSAPWVDCWLNIFGDQLSPELLKFSQDGFTVGCCLVVRRTELLGGIPLRRLYLNCAGEDEKDSTCIEFNSLLALPEYKNSVASEFKKWLQGMHWDDLVLSGVVEEESFRLLASSFGKEEIEEIPAYFIDFLKIRASQKDLMGFLGSKTRYHIRRTQRAYEESAGKCTTRIAQTIDEALMMLRQLADLHQARWTSRGNAGSFSSDKFIRFHETLIHKAFDHCLLFRLQAGDSIVGLLYCFVYRGWVYHYQSGFDFAFESRRSPGLLTLYFLISECLERRDLLGFDFMAGDSEYKRSLTTASDNRMLRWSVIHRQTLPTTLFLWVRGLKRKYVQTNSKSRKPVPPPVRSESDADLPVPERDV